MFDTLDKAMISRHEQGQTLVYVLLFLVVGSLLVASLVPFLGAGFRRQAAGRVQVMAGYAAEAGIKRVVADLIRGADVLSPHYTVPKITVNDHTPTIAIRAATITLPSEQLYVDPGVRDPALRLIPAREGYLMRLHHVHEGELRVNWAYSPAGLTWVGIWKGLTAQDAGRIYDWPREKPLAVARSRPKDDHNHVSVDITTPGIYTIVFYNRGHIDRVTKPFRSPGGTGDTWIYVRAFRDYIITATAGGISVSAYVRQVPGFSEPPVRQAGWTGDKSSWITNKISIYTWNPP
ncbi:MAG: hypothetical protein AAGB97_00385 [Dehalococcoidia bacterium]